MEHPACTPLYRALIAERRTTLVDQLERLFREPREFVWEVGAGHGHFLNAYAVAHPNELCVGIDIISERVARALRKRDRARLPNLEFCHAEARLFLESLPAHARISRVFILFPDPWPKTRHHKHRILQPDFLDALAARTTADGRLYFRTDCTPYFDAARSIVRSHPEWEPVDALWPFEYASVFQSRAAGHHSLIARRRRP